METISRARICWAYGYKDRERALESVDLDISDGLISRSENPEVKPYRNGNGELRYAVYIDGMANDGFGY